MSYITDKEYPMTICKMGQGDKCCRYLGVGTKGWECFKESSLKETLDNRVQHMVAKSDNCKGFESEKLSDINPN